MVPYPKGLLIRTARSESKTLQPFAQSYPTILLPGGYGDPQEPRDAALTQAGQAFQDTYRGITVTLAQTASTTAAVQFSGPAFDPSAPFITGAAYNGGKKIVVLGSQFGLNARLLVNRLDISDSVTWLKRKDGVLKVKASVSNLNIKPEGNEVQVITSAGVISNPRVL
jgi:hypothetical protein